MLNGRYKLFEQIGEGIEAYVNKCEDIKSKKPGTRLGGLKPLDYEVITMGSGGDSSGSTSDLGSRGPEFDSFREMGFFFSSLSFLSLYISGASLIRSLVVQPYRCFNFPRKNGGLAVQLEARQKMK